MDDEPPRHLSNMDVEPRPDAGGSGPFALIAIVVVALGWFAVSWAALNSPFVDAVGEAAGGVLAMLVVISVVGALRRSRR